MRAKDLPVGWRIWAAVIIPLIGICVLGFQAMRSEYADYRLANATATAAETLRETSGLVQALQVERGLTVGYLNSKGARGGEDLSAARGKTDEAIALSRELMAASGLGAKAGTANPLARLDGLAGMRAGVDGLTVAPTDAFGFYTAAVSDQLQLARDLTLGGQQASLAMRMQNFLNLMHAKELA